MRISIGLLLLAAATASAGPFSFASPERKTGTRFGSVSMDLQHSWGKFYDVFNSEVRDHAEPDVRAGVFVLQGLAVGGWLTMLDFFPNTGSVFTHTPYFAFGPLVGYSLVLPNSRLVPYALLNLGFSASAGNWYNQWYSQRIGLQVGAEVEVIKPVGVGIEIGWFLDRYDIPYWTSRLTAVGNTIHGGLRLTTVLQP